MKVLEKFGIQDAEVPTNTVVQAVEASEYYNCVIKTFSEHGELLYEENNKHFVKVVKDEHGLSWHVSDPFVFCNALLTGVYLEHLLDRKTNITYIRPQRGCIDFVREKTEKILDKLKLESLKPKWKNLYDKIEKNKNVWVALCEL